MKQEILRYFYMSSALLNASPMKVDTVINAILQVRKPNLKI